MPETTEHRFRLHFGVPSIDHLIGKIPGSTNLKRSAVSNNRFTDFGLLLPKRTLDDGTELDQCPASATISILGGPGSGKSTLALHLASTYAYDLSRLGHTKCRIIYCSTDLSLERAKIAWKRFDLVNPAERHVPFEWCKLHGYNEPPPPDAKFEFWGKGEGLLKPGTYRAAYTQNKQPAGKSNLSIDLNRLKPGGLAKALGIDLASVVHFLDLTKANYEEVFNLVGALSQENDQWPHMLIIDAVEGLEALVGETDIYGEKRSRRARISQLVRLASDKAHLVFVDEAQDLRPEDDEEFVADLVLRLGSRPVAGYSRRTVEVLKARGQQIIRGEHQFVIRDRGDGVQKGGEVFPDVPPCENAYVHCSLSVDARESVLNTISAVTDEIHDTVDARLPFGIRYLDEMLTGQSVLFQSKGDVVQQAGVVQCGLPVGKLTVMVGPEGTHKTKAARAFLANAFELPATGDFNPDPRSWGFTVLLSAAEWTKSGLISHLAAHWKTADWPAGQQNVIESALASASRVQASTRKLFPSEVAMLKDAKKLLKPLSEGDPRQKGDYFGAFYDEISKRVLIRNIEVSYISENTFAHIFEELLCVAEMRCKELGIRKIPDTDCYPIRLLIDDFSVLKANHRVLDEGGFLFHHLVRQIKIAGVTTLLTNTGPRYGLHDDSGRDFSLLRTLADRMIYTWHVPFMNDQRVAIASLPTLRHDGRNVIRELKLRSGTASPVREAVTVDPHFECYAGIEVGQPELIPVEVILRGAYHSSKSYAHELEQLLGIDFRPGNMSGKVVNTTEPNEYSIHRSWATRRTRHKHNCTTVIQVDEFWANHDTSGLLDLQDYLSEDIWQSTPCDLYADPTGSFSKRTAGTTEPYSKLPRLPRASFFDTKAAEESHPIISRARKALPSTATEVSRTTDNRKQEQPGKETQAPKEEVCDRTRVVPFYWDFGFLLLNRSRWEVIQRYRNPRYAEDPDTTFKYSLVRHVLQGLDPDDGLDPKKRPDPKEGTDTKERLDEKNIEPPRVTWREFLRACQLVAKAEYATEESEPPMPFDIDMESPESLSCLVLELWASEIEITLNDPRSQERLIKLASKIKPLGHADWIKRCIKQKTLYTGLAKKGVHTKPSESLWQLTDWLELFSLELYMVWQLLGETVNFHTFSDDKQRFEPICRAASPLAVASRHWYSTACNFTTANPDLSYLIVKMPGSYSTRGDWFLGITSTSRSERLGRTVVDMMCSRRGNISRLQYGVGLPFRSIYLGEGKGQYAYLRTALPKGSAEGPLMTCEELEQRAPTCAFPKSTASSRNSKDDSSVRGWLWRSNIRGYHRQCRVFGKWLLATMTWMGRERETHPSRGKSGFQTYDRLTLFREAFRDLLDRVEKNDQVEPHKNAVSTAQGLLTAEDWSYTSEWLNTALSTNGHSESPNFQAPDQEVHPRKSLFRTLVLPETLPESEADRATCIRTAFAHLCERYDIAEEFLNFKERCLFLVKELESSTDSE